MWSGSKYEDGVIFKVIVSIKKKYNWSKLIQESFGHCYGPFLQQAEQTINYSRASMSYSDFPDEILATIPCPAYPQSILTGEHSYPG